MKVMFYSLNAAIWEHALPESRLVKALRESGYDVAYVSCGKAFPVHCTSMDAHGVNADSPQSIKNKICKRCKTNAITITNNLQLVDLKLVDYLQNIDNATVDTLLADVTLDNYLDFNYLNVPVGRIATYEPYLKHKKMSTELSKSQWVDYSVHLRNCLISLIGFSRIYEIEKPDKLFIYSPQYGVNGVSAEYAMQKGSSVYFMEGSSSNYERYSALRLWNWKEYKLVNPALKHWDHARNYVSTEDVNRVKGHINELYKANSFAVFSAPKQSNFNLKKHFNIPIASKVVMAALSSFDEAYSAYVIGGFPERKVRSAVFKDQFDWIEETIQYFKNKPDCFFIIRTHPRDYPNKRENALSEQAKVWQKILINLPSNIIVNSPDQNISIYNMLDQIDVLLTGWSATAIEAMLQGVPVVTYDQHLPSYPESIHLTGITKGAYYINIDKSLSFKNEKINSLNAYRWLAVSFSIGTIRITPAINIGKNWPKNLFFNAIKKVIRILFEDVIKRIDVGKSFGNSNDEKRFNRFVHENKNCLFEVVLEDGNEILDNDRLEKIISN